MPKPVRSKEEIMRKLGELDSISDTAILPVEESASFLCARDKPVGLHNYISVISHRLSAHSYPLAFHFPSLKYFLPWKPNWIPTMMPRPVFVPPLKRTMAQGRIHPDVVKSTKLEFPEDQGAFLKVLGAGILVPRRGEVPIQTDDNAIIFLGIQNTIMLGLNASVIENNPVILGCFVYEIPELLLGASAELVLEKKQKQRLEQAQMGIPAWVYGVNYVGMCRELLPDLAKAQSLTNTLYNKGKYIDNKQANRAYEQIMFRKLSKFYSN